MMILCAIPMICAAVSDMNKRIIPDWTWVAVLLTGGISAFFFENPYISLPDRILGLVLPGISLLLIAVKWGGVGGGDIKLMSAMGFCFGIYGLAVMLFFAALPAGIYSMMTKRRSVPLAVFLCIGYLMVIGVSFYMGGGVHHQ